MHFHPCNRHLLISPTRQDAEKEEVTVLLPESYAPSKEEFGSYVVMGTSPDCSIDVCSGDVVLVENNMVKELSFEGEIYSIILENYVFGCLNDNEPEEEGWDEVWEE